MDKIFASLLQCQILVGMYREYLLRRRARAYPSGCNGRLQSNQALKKLRQLASGTIRWDLRCLSDRWESHYTLVESRGMASLAFALVLPTLFGTESDRVIPAPTFTHHFGKARTRIAAIVGQCTACIENLSPWVLSISALITDLEQYITRTSAGDRVLKHAAFHSPLSQAMLSYFLSMVYT